MVIGRTLESTETSRSLIKTMPKKHGGIFMGRCHDDESADIWQGVICTIHEDQDVGVGLRDHSSVTSSTSFMT